MQGVIVTLQQDLVVAPVTSIRNRFRQTAAKFTSLNGPKAQQELLQHCADESSRLELLDFLIREKGVEVRSVCREIKGAQGTLTFRFALEHLLGKGMSRQQAQLVAAS